MVRWKPFGCLSLQALAPKWRAESLTRIQLARKTSGIWWGGGGGWGGQRWLFGNYLLSQSRGRKRHLEVSCSLQMHEEYFACACHSILSSYTQNWSDILSCRGAHGNGLFSNRLHPISLEFKSSFSLFTDTILNYAVYMFRRTHTMCFLIHKTIIGWLRRTRTHPDTNCVTLLYQPF